ncbi:MAG: hypothetical protein MRZ84_03245, partial [Eubacterium sp.]|nr:hypothetical protein [Eubacterium sp.]
MVLVGLVHQKSQQFELIQTAGFLLDSYVLPRNIPKISATMNSFLGFDSDRLSLYRHLWLVSSFANRIK